MSFPIPQNETKRLAALQRYSLLDTPAEALAEVKTLQGLLPICAHCKKIRDDQGYWSQIEHYIEERSEAAFSHGICEPCIRELYPELADEVIRRLHGDKPAVQTP